MEIWLVRTIDDRIKIPINPEEIGSERTGNFEDIILSNGDEKTVISGNNLRTSTISSFFPAHATYYSTTASHDDPMVYVDMLERWMDDREVLIFQVTKLKINRDVTIRSFTWREVGGAVGDIEFTLELKEYKPVTYSVIETDKSKTNAGTEKATATATATRPASRKDEPTSYTVKKGDSLSKISKKIYGNTGKWQTLYNANKSVVGKNPNLIYPGQKLVIPWK